MIGELLGLALWKYFAVLDVLSNVHVDQKIEIICSSFIEFASCEDIL